MKHLKRLGMTGALAITALGMAGSAQATQLTPTGAARTFSSSNSLLAVHQGGTVRCTSSTLSGTIPATSSTWVAITTALTFGFCTANGALPATVHVNCSLGITLHTMWKPIFHKPKIRFTLLPGCGITWTIPSIGCTFTANGPQAVGDAVNDDSVLTDGATPTIHLNNAIVPDINVDGPTTTACATNANHTATGTLTGTYTGNGTVDVDGS